MKGTHTLLARDVDTQSLSSESERYHSAPLSDPMPSQKDDVRLDGFRQFLLGMIPGPIAAATDAKLSGSRVVATDTSMPLRANALAELADLVPGQPARAASQDEEIRSRSAGRYKLAADSRDPEIAQAAVRVQPSKTVMLAFQKIKASFTS